MSQSVPPPTPRTREQIAYEAGIEQAVFDLVTLRVRQGCSAEDLHTGVGRAFKFIQKQIGVHLAAAEEQGNKIACGSGCWFCCAQIVVATVPEVLRIADHIRGTWTEDEKAELQARIERHRELLRAYREGETQLAPRVRCPLLQDNGTCSVWSVRPIGCMAFVSVNVDPCRQRAEDPECEEPVPAIEGQRMAERAGKRGYAKSLESAGLDATWIDLALGLEDALRYEDATERYLRGEDVFREAKERGRWPGRAAE